MELGRRVCLAYLDCLRILGLWGKEQKDLGQLVKTSLPCLVGGIELSDDLLVKTLIKNSLGPLVARIY